MQHRGKVHRASAQRRRAALLNAAAELSAEIGAGAVTHRAVAARAGVPLSTTSYFFDSIDDLVTEALRVGNEGRLADLDAAERVALETEARTECPETVIGAVVDCALEFDRGGEGAQVEFFLAAGRDQALQAEVTETVAGVADRIAGHLARAGAPQADGAAWAMAALGDGTMLHRLAGVDVDHLARLHEGLRLLAAAAMLGDDEVAELLARYDHHEPTDPQPAGAPT